MNKQKIINMSNLSRFWKNLEGWASANFQALFENDEEVELQISNLNTKIDSFGIVIQDGKICQEIK